MNTDNELLELAAKAISIELDFTIRGDFPPYFINNRGGSSRPGKWVLPMGDGEDMQITHWAELPANP